MHYLFVIGTSQAAPHVSGLGALLDSQYGGGLNASQLITRIQQGADDIGKPGTDPFYGKGRINVFNTLSRAPTPQPHAIANTFTTRSSLAAAPC